ncbi:peptidase U32 family protein [Plebeiibacterium sediminum]|uniref:U32 family peptidase n=1 Tax=Plebeiibacterium sediminum TaxID=2992112 RepID=A0AAE3M300_9BACT|nr:U32 family peptidase [Plebeiobacterium sediminum]MCW3786262.1 U32 family peptidase [Plebeiobacterium sediminum]
MDFKPELLIPAGNIEAFHAAIEGGADAIFLGLKQFNARGRAVNFSNPQLVTMLDIAEKHGVKIYVTLNTVIKNAEIPELLDVLNFLSQTKVSAVIIQDWGVWYLAKKFFPNLTIHASTQMANHNSMGANFSKKNGFERVIMARELTHPELEKIMQNSESEVEIFVHGALCYSFSGLCLFSSYLGGKGANRGQCTQPCRRVFKDNGKDHAIFSLKDNQQISMVPDFARMNVASLKIEGRMKSASYVYRVAQAYRMAIDDHSKIKEAEELLKWDFGREKTDYFMGGKVKGSISDKTNNGIYLGKVKRLLDEGFVLQTDMDLEKGQQLRVVNKVGDSVSVKVKEFEAKGNEVEVYTEKDIVKGNDVYLIGLPSRNFPSKFEFLKKENTKPISGAFKRKIRQDIQIRNQNSSKPEFFVRIDNLEWLRKLRVDDFKGIFLDLPKDEWRKIPFDSPFFKNNIFRFYIEIPGFISENHLQQMQQNVKWLIRKGLKNFVISHLSQFDLFPKGVNIITNERVYTYNDAAIKGIKSLGVAQTIYPVESDYENLQRGTSRDGIVSMYANPELFFARMPVSVYNNDDEFKDNTDKEFKRYVRNGMTSVYSKTPVALLQYSKSLMKDGFSRFLFDLRTETPSKHLPVKLFKKFKASEQLQPSTTFNFKRGLS